MINVNENAYLVRDNKYRYYYIVHTNCGGALGMIQDEAWDTWYRACSKCGNYTINQEDFDKALFIAKSLL